MITVSTEKNKSIAQHIINSDGYSKNCVLLTAKDAGEISGYIALCKNDDCVKIEGLRLCCCTDYKHMNAEERYLSELLIRAAANYAVNRNIYKIESEDNNTFIASTALGMNEDEEKTQIHIENIFKCKAAKTKK